MPEAQTRIQALRALRWFRISSYVTGIFLRLLMVTWAIRRLPGLGYDLWAFGPNGIVSFESYGIEGEGLPTSGLNLTVAILIVHGWLYVVYLLIDFRLWTLLRWPISRALVIALGGVVPALSFFTERRYRILAERELNAAKNE